MSVKYLQSGDVCKIKDGEYCAIVYAGYDYMRECYTTILIVPIVHRDALAPDYGVIVPVEVAFQKVAVRCDLLQAAQPDELTKVDRLSLGEVKMMKEGIRLVMEL